MGCQMLNIDFDKEENFFKELFAAGRYILQDGLIEDNTWEFAGSFPEFLDIHWNYGVSKFVITPYGKDYVIKIPFDVGGDYCGVEEDIYNMVKKKNEEYLPLFAEIKKCPYSFLGADVYVQEKAICYADVSKFQLYHYDPAIEKLIRSNISSTLDEKEIPGQSAITWWINVLSGYFHSDMQNFHKFIDFLHENELDTDLHFRNVGYYPSNDLPVIFDYSGFQEISISS